MPKKLDSNTWDIIIVGAGISGFHTAIELLKWRPSLRIAIADKYKFLGGRTFTFEADISGTHYQWEEGAARFSRAHPKLLALIRRYKLETVEIGGDLKFVRAGQTPEPDEFSKAIPALLEPLLRIPANELATKTIRALLEKIHGRAETDRILIRHPYRSELNVMRADMALELFATEFRTFEGYSILKDGFSELVRRLENEFQQRGGTILRQHELVKCHSPEEAIFLKGKPSDGPRREEVRLRARAFVLAVPVSSLKGLEPFASLPWLQHLRMEPLLRFYAAFPVPKGGKAWFADLPKFVTPAANRFFIPGDAATGSCQISYTDSVDALPLMKILKENGAEALGDHLMETLRTTLGRTDIPDPLFVKAHSWPDAVTYWLPGDYDPYKVSKEACQPLKGAYKGWFLCGESYSTRQCWVEGALEHADMTMGFIKKFLVQ